MSTLSCDNIVKDYPGTRALDHVSASFDSGKINALLGKNGSGKSTLLRCMNWLEQPDRGEIHIGGQRLGIDEQRGRAMSHRQLAKIRERVGMVFQSFNLWPHLTVQQNVSEALLRVKGMKRDEANAMAMQQLEKVGMAHKADVYPITLSGGQKQRVAIARSLAMSPEVILFDEPTSALDPELVNEVLGVMKALAAEGYTMVVVTHEMDFARQVSNEVVFLEKGLLIEKAPPEKFFTQPDSERVRQFLQSSR